MNRRTFLNQISMGASLGVPFSMALLTPLLSMAKDDSDWIVIPGTDGKLLYKNLFRAGTAQCALYKLAPGFVVSAHRHPAGEYNYLVEGSFESDEGHFTQGSATYKEPGSTHGPGNAGPDGATILVFTPEPIVKLP